MNRFRARMLVWFLVLTLIVPMGLSAQSKSALSQAELSQIVAPIALYPDDLIAQILMASTYPLEIVEAARWVKANPNLKGSQLASALEKQKWDPSVKSLVNLPQVLNMMNDQLDWTQKLGNAFLAQQKDIMNAIQGLRVKAKDQGNLKTTKEQKVVVQEQVIVIQPADPQVVYVPVYNPTVVYGTWAYPSYPPPYYPPPGYTAGVAMFSFAAGAAVGAAWGYAWGGCNWHGGDVNVNVNKNISYNNTINRNAYVNQVSTNPNGTGQWKHDPNHRGGVAYRDSTTAAKYGQTTRPGSDTRKNYRGYTPDSTRPGSQGGGQQIKPSGSTSRPGHGSSGQQINPSGTASRPGQGSSGQQIKTSGTTSRPDATKYSSSATDRSRSGNAFEGMDRSSSETRMASDRGRSSRESMASTRPGTGDGARRR